MKWHSSASKEHCHPIYIRAAPAATVVFQRTKRKWRKQVILHRCGAIKSLKMVCVRVWGGDVEQAIFFLPVVQCCVQQQAVTDLQRKKRGEVAILCNRNRRKEVILHRGGTIKSFEHGGQIWNRPFFFTSGSAPCATASSERFARKEKKGEAAILCWWQRIGKDTKWFRFCRNAHLQVQ